MMCEASHSYNYLRQPKNHTNNSTNNIKFTSPVGLHYWLVPNLVLVMKSNRVWSCPPFYLHFIFSSNVSSLKNSHISINGKLRQNTN